MCLYDLSFLRCLWLCFVVVVVVEEGDGNVGEVCADVFCTVQFFLAM